MEVDESGEAFPQHQSREVKAPDSEIVRTENQSVPPQPLTRNKGKQPISSQSLAVPERSVPSQPASADGIHPDVRKRTESNSNSSPICLRDRGKEPLLPQNGRREKRSISEMSSHAVCIKDPKVDAGIIRPPKQKVPNSHALIKPKDEPFTDDMPRFEVLPIAVIHPGMSCLF